MPLIQWIMQNLGKNYVIKGSGTIVIYGDSAKDARYSENFYQQIVKFSIGSTGFDLNGYPWVITGVHVATNGEVTYFGKSGTKRRTFKDSTIVVNQEDNMSCIAKLECLQNALNKPLENLPTYEGKRVMKV